MPLNIEAAREIQQRLARHVEFRKLGKVDTVAGLDVAYRGDVAYAAAVVVDIHQMREVAKSCVITKTKIPYVPTYLAFREITPMVKAYLKLRHEPDAILVDGHGVAHPRKFGIASHIAVVLKKPTIGVAKTLLYGVEKLDEVRDPHTGEVLAKIVKCKGKKYVSVGSYATLEDAENLVKKLCTERGVLPLALAHETTQRLKTKKVADFNQWGEALPDDENWDSCP